MSDYKPPFTITNEILSYVSSISEKVGQINATSNLEAKPHLRRNNRIKSIHSSLKIEANSLSLGQVRDVNWMKEAQNNVHPLILSCVLHYEFVFIHPFSDGNGRMARLWHTAILAKWKPVFEYVPIESQIEKFQDAMPPYPNAILMVHLQFLLNLCCRRLIKF